MIKELQARALAVLAPPNPLRGLAGDAEYIASFVNQIEGPVSTDRPRKRLGFGRPRLTDPAQ